MNVMNLKFQLRLASGISLVGDQTSKARSTMQSSLRSCSGIKDGQTA